MTTKKTIYIIGGTALAYFLYKQYKNAIELGQSAIFSPDGISLDITHALAPLLVIKVNVTNPSPNSVTINKVFGIISFEGKQIGTINNNYNTVIAATSTSSMDLNITINNFQLISDLLSLDLSKPLDLTIDGYFVANQIQLPLNLDYNLKSIGATSNVQTFKNPIIYNIVDVSGNVLGSFTRQDFKKKGKPITSILHFTKLETGLNWFANGKKIVQGFTTTINLSNDFGGVAVGFPLEIVAANSDYNTVENKTLHNPLGSVFFVGFYFFNHGLDKCVDVFNVDGKPYKITLRKSDSVIFKILPPDILGRYWSDNANYRSMYTGNGSLYTQYLTLVYNGNQYKV
jgi:hypothetical protein